SQGARMIPVIDIAALFTDTVTPEQQAARDRTDAAIATAARDIGFMLVDHLPAEIPLAPAQLQELKRVFTLPPQVQRRLWRQKFAPDNRNVYRGWFPLQEGHPTYKEGIDIGPDLAYGPTIVDADDPR